MINLLAAEGGYQVFDLKGGEMAWLIFSVATALLALGVGFSLMRGVLAADQGTPKMQEIAKAIQEGAMAYLKRQFRTIGFILIPLAIIVFLTSTAVMKPDSTEALSFAQSGIFRTLAFLAGCLMSGLTGFIGMGLAVRGNVRTAAAARSGSLPAALKVAFRTGGVAGMFTVGLGLLGATLIIMIFQNTSSAILVGFGFGGSRLALFLRVGGGIFTKAADVGADLVGKVEAGIPEDDPRNPATIADNVGDNVGDAAGMGSDVYESYIVTILAAMLLGALVAPGSLEAIGGDRFGPTLLPVVGIEVNPLVIYPMLIGASGLIASIVGAMTITSRKISDPMNPLNIAFIVSAAIAIVLNFLFTTAFLGYNLLSYSLFATTVVVVILVPVIQRITDYYTNSKYKPVQEIADSTKWGYASNTLTGIIMVMRSTGPFMLAIVIVLGVSYGITFGVTQDPLMGIYGTAMAAMAMLSLAGIVLCIDAFGPISDNAGGIVEMTNMGEDNRTITDKIDAAGNTTKAITKGFAIASAGLAALAMIQAFQHEADRIFPAATFEYSLSDVGLIIGLLVGGLIPFFVTSLLIAGVSRSASKMVDEVRRQFKERPGIMDGSETPDYAKCVDIATTASLRELWKPALVTIAAPIVIGVLLGPTAVAGVLMGAVVSGLFLAYHLANSGGAWDNAKKYIEMQGNKKTEAHAIAVVGDLIGDPYKDTAGPALNTVIKLLNTIAIVFVPVFIAILAL